MRLLDIYRQTDPTLAHVLEDRINLAAIARSGAINRRPDDTGPTVQIGNIAQVRAYFAEAAGAAAKFLASPDGPRVGALALDGWDTHVNEGAVNGRLAALLGLVLRRGLGSWAAAATSARRRSSTAARLRSCECSVSAVM